MDYLPHKEYPYRKCLIVGGDLINYTGDVGISTEDMITSKLLFNSVLSTKYSKLMVINNNIFYLNTPTYQYDYTRLPIGIIPQGIIDEYKLTNKVKNAFIMCEI